MTRASRGEGVPPVWKSVLAVIAHPDDQSFGLGTILDAFRVAGARVKVLCLTHNEVWTLKGAPGDLAELRGAELASGADVLGAFRTTLPVSADGALSELGQTRLAARVVATAASSHPDGLLVFDTAAVTGHVDHVAATSAALLAAETLGLPVLGWTLSEAAAAQLNQEFRARFIDDEDKDVDLRVTLERARQRLARRTQESQGLQGSAGRHRLELLADTDSLRWLRHRTGERVPGRP